MDLSYDLENFFHKIKLREHYSTTYNSHGSSTTDGKTKPHKSTHWNLNNKFNDDIVSHIKSARNDLDKFIQSNLDQNNTKNVTKEKRTVIKSPQS